MVHFVEKEVEKEKEILNYFTLRNLEYIRQHADMCAFHWCLMENFNYVSHWKSLEYVKEVKDDLGIFDFEEEMRNQINYRGKQEGEDQGEQMLLEGESEQLAKLALKRCK